MGKISLTARTVLVFIKNRKLIVDWYIKDILEERVVPLAFYIGQFFCFSRIMLDRTLLILVEIIYQKLE